MAKTAFLVFLVLLSSCANMSRNRVRTEDFSIRGGKFANQTWNDRLTFDRTSWYAELTLVYDLLLTQLTPQSPFWAWLSNTEKETIQSCANHYIVLAYSQDNKKISHSSFKVYASDAGYRSFALPNFKNYLELHPDYAQNSFHLYQVFGLCLEPEKAKRDEIAIQFPNFNEVVLK